MATISFYWIFFVLSIFFLLVFVFLISLTKKKNIEEKELSKGPSVNLYVPCKDSSPSFEKNIRSIASQEYKNLEIYFIVGSKNDTAYPIIKKTVKGCKILVSGKAESCSQKNHNLLFGIKNSRKSDIYAFFDSDIQIEKTALGKLVGNLEKKTAVTSFPIKDARIGGLAETIHHLYCGFQYILCSSFNAIWGGYFGMHREDFEKLNVKGIWSKTLSDDMALTKILADNKFKVKFLKSVEIIDSNAHTEKSKSFSWITRQTMMIKHYLSRYWVFSILFVMGMIIVNLGLLVFTIISPNSLKLALDGFILLMMFIILHAISRITNKNVSLLEDIKFSIPALFIIFLSILTTIFIHDVIWSGHRYRISGGIVKKID